MNDQGTQLNSQLNSQSKDVIQQEIAVPYVTTDPTTMTPKTDWSVSNYFDGTRMFHKEFIRDAWYSIVFGGVQKLVAGTGISLSPAGGTGDVTVSTTLGAKYAYGTANYAPSDSGTQFTITTTDVQTSATFQPRALFVIGYNGSLQSIGICAFNGTAVGWQDNVCVGGTRTNGWVVSFSTGTPGGGMQADSCTSSSFLWTVKNSTGANIQIDWVVIG